MDVKEMPAGREMDALVAKKIFCNEWTRIAPDQTWDDILPYSTDIAAAMPLAEKFELTLVSIPVYSSEAAWDEIDIIPIKTWWAAFQPGSNPSIYLPIEDYDKEWEGWVGIVDESITLDMVAPTLPLAICRAALMAVGGGK